MNISEPFRARALEPGITEQLIRKVMYAFYGKVRSDAVLGPIFAEAIGTDWGAHIERIISFWLSATRLKPGYEGNRFMPAHVQHKFIRSEHLPRWLALFRETASEHCSPLQSAALVNIAERMAENIAIGIERRDLVSHTANRIPGS
jgi:hemoglobin